MTNWQKQFKKEFSIHFSKSELQFALEFIDELLYKQAKQIMAHHKKALIETAIESYKEGQLMAIKKIEEWIDRDENWTIKQLKAKLKTLTK